MSDGDKQADIRSKVGAYYWSETFKSPAFAEFSNSANSPADAEFLKRVSLEPEDRSVARLVITGVQKEEAVRLATLVAKTIDSYSRAQERRELDEARARLREQIAKNPLDRAQLEERLHESYSGIGVVMSPATRVIDQK